MNISFNGNMGGKLETKHAFILGLLDHGEMTIGTLASVDFGTVSQTKRWLGDLVNLGLVEKRPYGESVKYKRR